MYDKYTNGESKNTVTTSQWKRSKLRGNELGKFYVEFEIYDENLNPSDQFYISRTDLLLCRSLTFIVQIIFTLSKRKTAVERDVSINKNFVGQDLIPETIIVGRLIEDRILKTR